MAQTVCGIPDYLPGSFRGVPFDVVELTAEHGRRGAEGEYPFGESTNWADLGRKIRRYTVRGKLQNDNHLAQRAALRVACETPGSGPLVFPTEGIVIVACKNIKFTENLEDSQGITEFDAEFVEANEIAGGFQLVGSLLGLAIGTIVAAARDSFRARYDMQAVPLQRRDVVRNAARGAVGQIRTEYERAIAGTTDVRKYRALADLRDVETDPNLIDDVVTADRAIALGMNAVALETAGQAKFDAFRRLANANAKTSQLGDNVGGDAEDAVYSTVRTIAGAYMAQAAMEITFARTGDAFAALDAVTAVLDQEAEAARIRCDNALFDEIAKFSTDVQQALYDKAYKLPALISFRFNGATHPLVAAYSLFGDAKRHREIEVTNIVDQTGRVGPAVVASSL